MRNIILFYFFFTLVTHAQELKISGKITDIQNIDIRNASVIILDENEENLGYDFTDENGNYYIIFNKPKSEITIEISCLGYQKLTYSLTTISNSIHNFSLEEKLELLEEVVINSERKVKIEQDTTTIKVASFTNKTEQTLEDILKKLPGIEVLKDGIITAHGKTIDKLLIEGEDMFDRNYRLLSKNLDAEVLDAVQILDNFEDNPILKKISDSDKVALNLRLKKEKKNIWFGNITLGTGVISENRWKESLNLGLLKKKIKLLYISDYNNLGERASDLITNNVIEKTTFSNDVFEYKLNSSYNINSNEVEFFSKTQSIFNNAFLNSLSFTTKVKANLSLRGVLYIVDDKQIQDSFAKTVYNLENSSISFIENNSYRSVKKIASTELELKYSLDSINYITNLLIFKDAPLVKINNLIFNADRINQSSKITNYTFYNHFNHTLQITENKILNNYIYIGNDKLTEKTKITSPFLNEFLDLNSCAVLNQIRDSKLFYIGIKSKLITKYRAIDITNSVQYELNNNLFDNTFTESNIPISGFENILELKQSKFIFENALRYYFSRKIDLTGNLSFQQTGFEYSKSKNDVFFISPNISMNLKKTGLGNFSLSYSENNLLPEINQLINNYQLLDYRSFTKGTVYQAPIKNAVVSFSHYFSNDEKRFSLNTKLFYIKSKSIFNTKRTLTDDFNFYTYLQTGGGENYNLNFSCANYIRKLKLASKIETNQVWSSSPININADTFTLVKSYINNIKYTATTYFKESINFDAGFSYYYNQSVFNNLKTKNITKDYFLNINYTISKTLLAESNNSLYFVNNQNYLFNNMIINFNPIDSKFSYRLILNNILNETKYHYVALSNYTVYQSSIQLVPRYLLCTVKYRF